MNDCTSYNMILTQVIYIFKFLSTAPPPPVNVVATQSTSGSVEISWNPPLDEPSDITGYRIFYGDGMNLSVYPIVNSVGWRVNATYQGQSVSIRSESGGIISELVRVSVTASELE